MKRNDLDFKSKVKLSQKNKQILYTIPKILILMCITGYLSGFVKVGYDYIFVSVIIIVVGMFLFFIDIKKYVKHI